MEMYPVDRTEEHTAADAPEDLAVLSSGLIAEEAKLEDFSANRREYRAQMRHRAAEQLRLMELRAQSEAEAAADRAEGEAAAAHAEADAATVRLVAGRAMQATGTTKPVMVPVDLASEEEMEHLRRSSLRDAAQHARRAAAERLEAARRAEAAALADSIARREEREIAEAQASAMRQAAHDAESEARSRQKKATLEESLAPDRIPAAGGPWMVGEDRRASRENLLAGHRGSGGHHQPKPLAVAEDLPRIARETLNEPGRGRLPIEHKDAAGDANGRGRPRERVVIPSMPYAEFRRAVCGEPPTTATEAVNKHPVLPVGVVEFASRGSGKPAVPRTTEPVTTSPASSLDARRQNGNGKLASNGTHATSVLPKVQVSSGAAENSEVQTDSSNGFESLRMEAPRTAVPHAERLPVDLSGPAWLYPNGQSNHSEKVKEVDAVHPIPRSMQGSRVGDERSGQIPDVLGKVATDETRDGIQDSKRMLFQTQDETRWFALKGLFTGIGRDESAESNRNQGQQFVREEKRNPPFVLVYSVAGGVGKTSLVASLGRAMSSFGERVLLADTSLHGPLPFYFGARAVHPGAVRTFLPPRGNSAAPIQVVNYNLTGIRKESAKRDSDAHSEIIEHLIGNTQRVSRVLIDLSVCDEWVAGRLAPIRPTVLVPLMPDMNSIISVKGIERNIRGMQDGNGKSLEPIYLLNQFDASLPLHVDMRMLLKQQLGDRLLPFVIRKANEVSEALAEGMTVFDYAPESETAKDYLAAATWLRSVSVSTIADAPRLRWNEG